MNLVIDQGNTVTKFAVFKNGEMLDKVVVQSPDIKFIDGILKKFPGISSSILSSVADYDENIPGFLQKNIKNFIVLNAATPIPIINLYLSKETLGYDRIADAVGALGVFPGKNILIIDAGTAITIDLLTSKGEFYGGNISPGIDLRFRALHEHTKKLPEVKKRDEFPLLGKTTEEAILAGVLNGVVFEIDGYIDKMTEKYSDLKTILTGGDSKYFDKKLKNSIFVHSNLNLSGLNRILEYNVENK